jgi:hypothetical protein
MDATNAQRGPLTSFASSEKRATATYLMWIRLVRKLAEVLDGIDVSNYAEGDALDLPRAEAELLIAERWAVPLRRVREVRAMSVAASRAVAADAPLRRRTVERLRRIPHDIDTDDPEQQPRRRAEDHIREELHDARATLVVASTSPPMTPTRTDPKPPPCPSCQSIKTIRRHEQLGKQLFLCADCEHSWR